MTSENGGKVTLGESDVYDRQIRLWGAEAQNKIRNTKVLYVTVSGVSSEIIKNLVLAGVRAAICDGRPFPEALSETPSSFLPYSSETTESMSVAEAMKPLVHELNPLLDTCEIQTQPDLSSIPDTFFQQYDIVIISGAICLQNHSYTPKQEDLLRISNLVTANNGKFILVDTFGMYGCALLDLGPTHQFRKEQGKDKLSDLQSINPYVSFSQMMTSTMTNKNLKQITDRWHKNGPPKVLAMYLALLYYSNHPPSSSEEQKESHFSKVVQDYLVSSGLDANYLGDDLSYLYQVASAEISPVCAVLGGVMGNEVIKAISGKGEPANNTLLFDGTDGGCRAFVLQPPSS